MLTLLLLLAIALPAFGQDDPRAQAAALAAQGKYAEAEPLLIRILDTREKEFGPDDPALTSAIDELAALYRAEGRATDAEKLYLRSLQIKEKTVGGQSVELIPDLKLIAGLYAGGGRMAASRT